MKNLVLWDLDGTLVDPADAITGGMADAIEEHGFARPSAEVMRKFVGPPALYCLENFTDIPEVNRLEVLATYRAGYRERGIARSRVYPGIRELLEALKAEGVLVGLATQKTLFMGEKVLDYFDLTRYFDVVSGSPDELGTGNQDLPKDKPGIIAKALTDLGVVPGENCRAVMVGDRLYDAEGARANGMPSIGVGWGYGSLEELAAEFDYRVDDTAQLAALIQKLLEVELEVIRS